MVTLVTGGGGFLGFALIEALLARGHRVRTINRSHYPELDALDCEVLKGDLADEASCLAALADVNLVFHVAAKPGVWGDYADYHRSNVTATENLLKACRKLGVPRFIYTSSPSVTFGGADQNGVDESTPYPESFMAAYPATKAEAERLVLAANSPQLATVSLRPHLIWGPRDRHIIPRLLSRARAGRLRLIGDSSKLVDAVYIDNAVEAHLCAMDRLKPGALIAGKAYFVSNHEPWPMEKIINSIMHAAGQPPVTARISSAAAFRVARLLEWVYTLFRLKGEPALTRFAVAQLSTAHWYDPKAAREELGYTPKVSMDEGFERLKHALQG